MNAETRALLIDLRRRLHDCPELSGREDGTRALLRDFLRAHTTLGLEEVAGALIAIHREGEGLPTLAFRADMDAIPDGRGGARHGCGHDGHSAALCGLALALEGRRVGGNVALLFQPAEETGEGAKGVCAAWPGLDSVARIYALHNIPGFPRGAVLMRRGCFACASCGLVVTLTGRPAHAAYPGDGANPCALLSRLVLALPEMIQAVLAGADRLLMHTVVGLRAGGEDFGLSAAEGRLCLTLRGHRQADIDALIGRIEAAARAGCAEEGLRCSFELRDVFPDTTNDSAAFDEALARFHSAGLPVVPLAEPMRWSEDFGWFLKRRPGVYFGIGAGEDCPGLHTAEYGFDDALLEAALRALCALLPS